MKNRGIVLLPLLLIIAAVVTVSLVGYFVWQANQGNSNTSNGNINSVVVQNSNVNSNTNQAANANVVVANTNSTTTSSGRTVRNDYCGFTWKLSPDEEYLPADPSKTGLTCIAYTGDSVVNTVLGYYGNRIRSNEVTTEMITLTNGKSAVLITGSSASARAEGLDYVGTVINENIMAIVFGESDSATALKQKLNTLTFTKSQLPNNVSCTPDSIVIDRGIKSDGNYYFEIPFIEKMDASYLKSSGFLTVSVNGQNTDFTLDLQNTNETPIIQKAVVTIDKNAVTQAIQKKPMADQPNFTVFFRQLKTEGGEFCGGLVQQGFSITDPTAGWETYTNSTYNYSIQYPSDYRPSGAPWGTAERFQLEKGESGKAGYVFLNIRIVTQENATNFEDKDLYTWATQGFPANAPTGKFHENPRPETIGNLTFTAADGDRASTGIPEYFLFHNDIVYHFSSYTGGGSQSSNKELLATFQFTN